MPITPQEVDSLRFELNESDIEHACEKLDKILVEQWRGKPIYITQWARANESILPELIAVYRKYGWNIKHSVSQDPREYGAGLFYTIDKA